MRTRWPRPRPRARRPARCWPTSCRPFRPLKPACTATRPLEPAARIALRCLDLTSLNDADGEAEVARLCARAQGPFGAGGRGVRLAALGGLRAPAVAAVRSRVAAVANFPAGGSDIGAALRDVQQIVAAGAQEVDVVLPWRALQRGDAAAAEALLRRCARPAPGRRLKVILETGELRDDALIAARLAAGAGCRRRFPQDQHRQDARRRHAGRGARRCCAPSSRDPHGARPCRAQGLGRHPPRRRCVALHRAVPPVALGAGCAAAAALSHRRQQPARRHRGGARRHGRAARPRAATEDMLAQEIIRIKRDGGVLDSAPRSTPSSPAWSTARGARARPRRWPWRCSSRACRATRPSR